MATPYQLIEGVAVVALNNPPVNALALALRLQVRDALRAAMDDPAVQAIVLTGEGRNFCGGGDIHEFNVPAAEQEPTPMTIHALIEDSAKPVVAALHGVALGGGLELAMSCHARVAQADTLVGLPEVQLGLLPGAGGTYRLPRLVGIEPALNLIVTGQRLTAAKLRDSGLFDQVVDTAPVDAAVSLARELAQTVATGGKLRRTSQIKLGMDNAQAFFAFARGAVKAQARGLPAPPAALDCVENAVTLPVAKAAALETEAFLRLRQTPQFQGLRHAFDAERQASVIRGLPPKLPTRELNRAVVVGGGTMGSGITISLLGAGLQVTLVERDQASMDRGLSTVQQYFEGQVKKGRITEAEQAQRLSALQGGVGYEAAREADLVIEAVFEDMAIKRALFQQLDALAPAGAVLATNTSMLDVNEIAAVTKRPEDVVGLHFFSPAHVMKLLEIVRGARTSDAVMATSMALARSLGKTAVVSGVCDGFIGNRMLMGYVQQATVLLDEGALPQQVDRAIEAWGMAMGPFRLSDLAGVDLGAKIQGQHQAGHPACVFSRTHETIAAMGRHGQKNGKGWYDYVPGQRAPVPSKDVEAVILEESNRLGLQRRAISDEEIVDRMLLALVNEGAKILEEGIAQRASDIDVVYTAGYGFPRWRGGPMFAADRRGLADIVSAMRRFSHGPAYQQAATFWQPAPLLVRLAESGQAFSTVNTSESA